MNNRTHQLGSAFLFGSFVVLSVFSDTHYVAVTNLTPVAPYTDWVCAATNIQDAVDMADAGDTVLVGPGVYYGGGHAATDGLLNRVAITNAITLRSMQGAGVTTISAQPFQPAPTNVIIIPSLHGARVTTSGAKVVKSDSLIYAPHADIRGVWIAGGAIVDGFTITGGYAHLGCGYGGGVYGEGLTNIVINCVLSNNSASVQGAGAYRCTVQNCTIIGNSVYKVDYIIRAAYGGGAGSCILRDCVLYANYALGSAFPPSGGGGGAYNSALLNCTVYGNVVEGGLGGGVYSCALTNCIVTGNTWHYGPEWRADNHAASALRFSCASPLASGEGNIEADPVFEGGADFHLQSSSPCINAGTNLEWMTEATDLDGLPRIADGRVDMGAYENSFIPAPVPVPCWWLSRYPILLNLAGGDYEAAALADVDGDGHVAWQEYVTGSIPTNTASVLRALITMDDGAPQVTWTPDLGSARMYSVVGRTNLADAVWYPTNTASRFFRVKVDMP